MMKSRREFLVEGSTVLSGLAVSNLLSRSVHAGHEAALKLGVIGVGWYGMVDARAALQVGGVEIAAICDVDSEHLEKSASELEKLQGKRPKMFKLYEDMLSQTDLDAVIIASPPHWHALHLWACLKHNLDVYCEKPLAYDIRECQAMVSAVQRSGRIVQVGFQRRQHASFQQVRDFIASGEAGNIVQVDAQIHYRAGTKDPTPKDPPPSLDWNLWCGPGPLIPYSEQVGHFNWRLEKTSGHGHLVDWGIHLIDATRMILGLTTPQKVVAAGGIYQLKGIITTPDTLTVHFEFDRCPVVWRHRLWGAEEYSPDVNNGIFFYGTKATVFVTDGRWVVVPAQKNSERKEYTPKTDAGVEHMRNFLTAVRERKQPACPIEEGYRSTATVKLAMIAYESDSIVRWDESQGDIQDNPTARALLKREYRAPWRHPADQEA
ncbi:MAG TPA: Gfo/Idh/MocA family oxidoreductase [Thermogutta sp.]|nr:Gfo/Idh/MocA family oxidoreductase [Thermogutta sp.]HPU06811.1 Gfo/Idh/MocA family oxidoreductase [Thermogutta sp.]HQF15333.1 Gfo/Idh/MocA family oxidoreductase [Thermogutta sp.]